MNKTETVKLKYVIQWETHIKNFIKGSCSLMEHQSLVDIVICCGNNSIQAHKYVLASHSPLLREELERDSSIEQILITGCDFPVLKSVIEIMYCGQTIVQEENVKYLVALFKLFKMKNIQSVFSEHASCTEEIYLPKLQFLTKKPKYPSFSYQIPPGNPQNACSKTPEPTANVTLAEPSENGVLKPINFNIDISETVGASSIKQFKNKRALRQQAEQACVKEAQASRMALAFLQKEIAAAPQVNSFIIEDTCTETTVENFIPNSEQATPYVQMVDYSAGEGGIRTPDAMPPPEVAQNLFFAPNHGLDQNASVHQVIQAQFGVPQERHLTADKLKYMLGGDMSGDVEIMYKDAHGNFVPVNEEVLRNLSTKEGLQYQVVDEDGHVSEMQELQVEKMVRNETRDLVSGSEGKAVLKIGDFLKETQATLSVKNGLCSIISKSGEETSLSGLSEAHPENPEIDRTVLKNDVKFSPDIFFADIGSNEVRNEIVSVDGFEKAEKIEV